MASNSSVTNFNSDTVKAANIDSDSGKESSSDVKKRSNPDSVQQPISKRQSTQPSEFPFLERDIQMATTIQVESYVFKIFSIGERSTMIDPNLLSEVTTGMINKITACFGKEFDSLATIQTAGAMWAMPLALWAGKPLYIFTSEPNGDPKQKSIEQDRPYQKRPMYAPNMHSIGRTLIIDDVISGGGTIRQMKTLIEESGGLVLGAFCVIDKMNKAKVLSKELKMHVCGLCSL